MRWPISKSDSDIWGDELEELGAGRDLALPLVLQKIHVVSPTASVLADALAAVKSEFIEILLMDFPSSLRALIVRTDAKGTFTTKPFTQLRLNQPKWEATWVITTEIHTTFEFGTTILMVLMARCDPEITRIWPSPVFPFPR